MYQTGIRRLFAAAALLAFCASAAGAEQRGVTDSEIRIGQTMPYSGPLSAYSALGKAEIAYFNRVNDRGGINGRKVKLISLDDGYVPPRTVEQTRRLVESDEVALIFSSLGTAQNNAIAKYLQSKNVPQLFLASGASKFADVSQFPQALMGIQVPFRLEARLYARHAVEQLKAAKIAVLAQNDDFGRDYLAGLRDVLGSRFEQVVSVATYEVTEPTIDSQVVRLKASEADVLLIAATPKFAAQAVRKTHEIGWKPVRFLSNVSIWVSSVLEVAGLEASTGIMSTAFAKDPMDPALSEDGDVKEWRAFMAKYAPDGDIRDQNYVFGYNFAMALEHVLKAAGTDLSPENIRKQAYSISGLELPMLLPGIKVNTAQGDHTPVKQMQFMRFNGKQWDRFGEILSAN
jgi:branched-chain amino acid transport system substrate-binding protein